MGAHRATVVIMDDEPEISEFVKDVAESIGCTAVTPRGPEEFKRTVRELRPAVIVLDLQMPEVDGIELLRYLAEERSRSSLVLMSGADRRVLDTASRLGRNQGLEIAAALQKPIRIDELIAVLERCCEHRQVVTPLEIARALKAREIELHFQPKIDLQSAVAGRLAGAEALARWQHPRHGLLLPDSFIPIAERGGQIEALTNYVVDAGMRRLKAWRATGLRIPLAVNLPAQFFSDRDLPDRLDALARRYGVDAAELTLEVTETSAMTDVEQAMEVFTRLRLKGFPLAIDDFGTGYSSLRQLHRMPFTEMKIDKEFVQQMASNRECLAIVRSVVGLGRSLELKLCAEGIEDAEALRLLRELGCDYGQGYYFSPAVPSQALVTMARNGCAPPPRTGDGGA
jgi:EAL domain-containing protein (putative c-di-GMP-specific phosphodiesterase class I)